MTPAELCETIKKLSPPPFGCRPAPREGVLVQTPFLYPDGCAVEVSVTESDGQFVVTNHGDALRWLGMQSVRGGLSDRQNSLIDNVCQSLGVQLNCGRLMLQCNDTLELGKAIHLVGQAIVRLSDVWFTIPLSVTTTTIRPRPRGQTFSGFIWPSVWILFYVLCAVGAVVALRSEANGTSHILQILGVIITLTSLWATIRIRTSQISHTRDWRNIFDFMTGIGTALIVTGIYWDAVDKFDPIWGASMAAAVIVAWVIVWFGFGRGLR